MPKDTRARTRAIRAHMAATGLGYTAAAAALDAATGWRYLAGPGSVVDGQPYIIERAAPIRDLPGWLAAITEPPPQTPAAASGQHPRHAPAISHGGISPWD